MTVDAIRIQTLRGGESRSGAKYVLYWALINRRLDSNQAFAYAVERANELGLPLLVYGGLTSSHRWANARMHQFVLEGVAGNRKRAADLGAGYFFYLRKTKADPSDVLYRLAEDAALLVTDDYPGYMARQYNARVPEKIGIPYYAVDASCIVPMAEIGKQQYAAYTIRPRIHKLLDKYLRPVVTPKIEHAWNKDCVVQHRDLDTEVVPRAIPKLVAECEIDQTVPPVTELRGGRKAALALLDTFLHHNLRRYARQNREPSAKATSSLSSHLHFGYISSLEIALAVKDYAQKHDLIAEEFLEQLIVRRELAFNFARYGPRPDKLSEALPDWARKSLAKHDGDPRDYAYTREQWERAETHDPLWNATQKQLLEEGIIHGYYRMYWGKKIIEWSASHQEALDTIIYLNDRYALDGRDPNTYANILWCFGLHDRPWKERPVFGMIRYMSAEGMRRKTDVPAYVNEYDPRQMSLT